MCAGGTDTVFRDAEHAWGFHRASEEINSSTTAHIGAVQHSC